jgi:NTP pyrophosphatase (non-canonical NTP hydrolase)
MSRTETQQTVTAWAEETFGPVSATTVLVDRAQLEMDELAEAVAGQDQQAVGQEIADILILLYRLATLHGCDIDEIVTTKMQINRTRRWTKKGDGTGRHID